MTVVTVVPNHSSSVRLAGISMAVLNRIDLKIACDEGELLGTLHKVVDRKRQNAGLINSDRVSQQTRDPHRLVALCVWMLGWLLLTD